MKNRKVEIRIEKHERITFFPLAEKKRFFCQLCGIETVFIAPESAVGSFDMTMREIFRLVEESRIHYIEDETRATFVCLTSLENLTVNQPLVPCLGNGTSL